MGEQSSRYSEVAVRLVPAREIAPQGEEAERTLVTSKSYDALVYTHLTLPETPKLETPGGESPACWPESTAGMPLVGVEQVKIHWDRYRAYLVSFFLGEKAAWIKLRGLFRFGDASRERPAALFETVDGSFLDELLRGQLFADRPARVWWGSDAPDLVSLPWELMLRAARRDTGRPLSFVRGLPPEADAVKIPVARDKPLKLAFIHEPRTTSDALLAALESLKRDAAGKIEVELLTGPPREALQQAVSKGCELVHIVTDGGLSLANEGILYLRKSREVEEGDEGAHKHRFLRFLLPIHSWLEGKLPKSFHTRMGEMLETNLEIDRCPPGELSSALRGSRVGILCLSAPKSTDSSPIRIDGYHLPTVFRTFAALGGSTLQLPSIVAPSGATDEAQAGQFWHDFYLGMAETAELEPAMVRGLEDKPGLPMALFLRHRDGCPFKPLAADEQVTVEPTQLDAALQLSNELVTQLAAQAEEYGEVPESIRALLAAERERQERLNEELKRWV